MAQVLRHTHQPEHPDLIVGTRAADDAAVWRLSAAPDARALVATTDFFTPIVDDPHVWGRIAAANAAGDVYAMGGTPLFGLNVVAWPRDVLSLDLLGEVLEGAAEMAGEGGWVVVGGHTVDGPEPLFGQAVIGTIDPDRILTSASARPGDHLVLTKPIGTGIVATALKRSPQEAAGPGGPLHEAYEASVESMTRLNHIASRAALDFEASASTDVTGFGLLGHLHRMALASGVGAVVRRDDVPVLPGVLPLLSAGFVPGGTGRNVDYVRPHLDTDLSDDDVVLLADAQTSGGLLISCPPHAAEALTRELTSARHEAAVIGELTAGPAGRIRVV